MGKDATNWYGQNSEIEDELHAIICDVDGTVALRGDRDIYDYANVQDDKANIPIVKLVQELSVGRYVIFVSGRERTCYLQTMSWLRDTFRLTDGPLLYMRATGDYRQDAVIKKEMYEEYIQPVCEVDYVIDDRNQVVEMWRSLGLTCLQVADGDF